MGVKIYDVVFDSEGPMGIDLESDNDGYGAFVMKTKSDKISAGHSLVAVNNMVGI